MRPGPRLLLLLAPALASCSALGPSSRAYRPVEWEGSLLARALKTAMPSDVAAEPGRYDGELVHWVGVVDTAVVRTSGDTTYTEVRFEQHYYDYIEDFSIQTETMFVSPLGAGPFTYTRALVGAPADSARAFLAVAAAPGNLGFVYGHVRGAPGGVPRLADGNVRFVHERHFSTAIFSYDIERDADGRVVAGDGGFPKLKGLRFLKIAGPGEND